MENINHAIGCDVTECQFNASGAHCTLEHIMVGSCGDECNTKRCTCCASFKKK